MDVSNISERNQFALDTRLGLQHQNQVIIWRSISIKTSMRVSEYVVTGTVRDSTMDNSRLKDISVTKEMNRGVLNSTVSATFQLVGVSSNDNSSVFIIILNETGMNNIQKCLRWSSKDKQKLINQFL